MIAFPMDRLLVSCHSDAHKVNMVGHGVVRVFPINQAHTGAEVGCAVEATVFNVSDVTPDSLKDFLARVAACVMRGERVCLSEYGTHRYAPVLATAFMAMVGHSWDDAWDAMARILNPITQDPAFHQKIRLLARQAFAAMK